MLVHGLLGFDSLFGVYDYWYGIPAELQSGGAKVYVPNVSSANSSAATPTLAVTSSVPIRSPA